LRLVAIKSDRLHVGNQAVDAELDDCRRRARDGEKLCSRLVDALVGRLCGQDHCDKQLEGRMVLEFGFWIRIRGLEPLENLPSLLRIHGFERLRLPAAARRARARASAAATTSPFEGRGGASTAARGAVGSARERSFSSLLRELRAP